MKIHIIKKRDCFSCEIHINESTIHRLVNKLIEIGSVEKNLVDQEVVTA